MASKTEQCSIAGVLFLQQAQRLHLLLLAETDMIIVLEQKRFLLEKDSYLLQIQIRKSRCLADGLIKRLLCRIIASYQRHKEAPSSNIHCTYSGNTLYYIYFFALKT